MSGLIAVPIAAACFAALTWLELRRPLRRTVESKLRREARNFAVSAMTAVAMRLAETPLVRPVTAAVERRRWGLLGGLGLPLWIEAPAALVLMDYSFYGWHILMHRVPVLWRFHMVHHADLDMDASTALRFHFGEQLVSIPFRAAQVALIGLTPTTFSIWQIAFIASILFHHSNVQLPVAWERRLNRWIVTPRMHGIHHSIVQREMESNWSSGLTLWDRLHGTLRLNVPQDAISIGVPAWRDPESVTLPRIVKMPFEPIPPMWEDGKDPIERPTAGRTDELTA
jgi:sterol desaturase/sphingolipid hydroxylase (fatty acid hydroxylase superfamily)